MARRGSRSRFYFGFSSRALVTAHNRGAEGKVARNSIFVLPFYPRTFIIANKHSCLVAVATVFGAQNSAPKSIKNNFNSIDNCYGH